MQWIDPQLAGRSDQQGLQRLLAAQDGPGPMFEFEPTACGTGDNTRTGLVHIIQDGPIGRALHLHGAPFSIQAPRAFIRFGPSFTLNNMPALNLASS